MARSAALLAAPVIMASAFGTVSAAEVTDVLETSVGQQTMLKLPGNPRAGYRWQLNAGQSSGLNLVRVDQVGWIMAPAGRSIFFSQPSTLNVNIEGLAAGEANLTFDYFRTVGTLKKVKTSTVRVVVKPAAAKPKLH